MFSLLGGLLRWLFTKHETTVLMVGLDHAGKTTLLEQGKAVFRRSASAPGPVPLERIPPTVGLNIGRLDVGRQTLLVWDLGGQAPLRTIWTRYYAEAQAVVFVVDSTASVERMDEARGVLRGLLDHDALARIPFLLCCNKQDLRNAMPPGEIDAVLGFTAACEAQGRMHRTQPLSALMGRGVEDGYRWIAEAAAAMGPRVPVSAAAAAAAAPAHAANGHAAATPQRALPPSSDAS